MNRGISPWWARPLLPLAIGLTFAGSGSAQDAVYQKEKPFQFKLDALARQEWTRDIFVTGTSTTEQDRRRLQLRPALEAHFGPVRLGVGGDFNFSSDRNDQGPDGSPLALIRDNYRSRDARLDLAFAEVDTSWLRAEAGRFEMPVGLTEMIWDHDLRPQGGALTLGVKDKGAVKRAGLTGLWARGSHVYDDHDATMLLVSANVVLRATETATFELIGSYIDYSKFQDIEAAIRRQNTRVNGAFVYDYDVVDFVARYRDSGRVPLQLVADYCWNRSVSADNKGLWLAAALGSLTNGIFTAGYTYADVNKDATLAAYATDDFFWETGWKGQRAEIGFKLLKDVSAHAIAEHVQFTASPRPEERDHTWKRYRVELRVKY